MSCDSLNTAKAEGVQSRGGFILSCHGARFLCQKGPATCLSWKYRNLTNTEHPDDRDLSMFEPHDDLFSRVEVKAREVSGPHPLVDIDL